MRSIAVAGGEAKPVGAAADGSLPLPWLREPLAKARRLDRSHALLLHASMDMGQLDLALVLAQAWLCEQPGRSPCGQCNACRLVRQRTHPDLRIVVPESLRLEFGWVGEDDPLLRTGAKPSREIKVEQVRDAIEWSQRSAGSPRGRALVVSPADALNAASGNALLKTLEEPPGSLRIVMAGSDPEHLLPTLRSRVQRLRLDAPPAAQALTWLAEEGASQAVRALTVAGGSPLAALALHEGGLEDADARRLASRGRKGRHVISAGQAAAVGRRPAASPGARRNGSRHRCPATFLRRGACGSLAAGAARLAT